MVPRTVYLESDRLALREFRCEDWIAACDWLCDAEVMKFFGHSLTEDAAKAFIESLAGAPQNDNRAVFQLALVLRKDNAVVGDFSLFLDQDEYRPRHGALGYRLARRHWGHGYGSEGIGLLLRLGFEHLLLHKISAGVSSINPASLRALEKNGMRREGLLREHHFVNGVWHDEAAFGILAQEWRERDIQTPGHAE